MDRGAQRQRLSRYGKIPLLIPLFHRIFPLFGRKFPLFGRVAEFASRLAQYQRLRDAVSGAKRAKLGCFAVFSPGTEENLVPEWLHGNRRRLSENGGRNVAEVAGDLMAGEHL